MHNVARHLAVLGNARKRVETGTGEFIRSISGDSSNPEHVNEIGKIAL